MTRKLYLAAAVLLLLGAALPIAISKLRSNGPVLYYSGAAMEVPTGRALVVLNPLRDRSVEHSASRFLRGLHSSECAKRVHELHSDDSRICEIMQTGDSYSLLWRQDGSTEDLLVYSLPSARAILWLTMRLSQNAFVPVGISVVR